MYIYLKTAWDHVRRTPFQSLAAIFALAINFFVVTLLSTLVYSSSSALKYFETRPQVIAFLKDEASKEDIASLHQKISGDARVKKVTYISKEQALEIYNKATADNPLLSELVNPSIFPASLEISLTDLSYAQDVIEEIKKSNIIDSVGFTASLGGEETLFDVVKKLRTFTDSLRIIGASFSLLLALTSFFILTIIIGMRISSRRSEIEILRLIGATNRFIRSPIVIEAIIYAITGVLAGWLFAFLLVLYATPSIIAFFGEIPVLPKDTFQVFSLYGIILGGELLVGILLAVVGSSLAISRVKRVR